MKTKVRPTSIEAYHELDLSRQQREIMSALVVLGESCIADIATSIGWERSTVAGRMNELKQLGMLMYAGKQKSKTTGVLAEFWRAKLSANTLF